MTSRFREESIQDVQLAVSAFNEEAIKALSPSTLQDFDGLTPNVFIGMNAAGPGASAMYIRGIGYADIEQTQTPNVGVVIDEDNDFTVLQGECPYCHGLFAVDLTYIEQVDTFVHCPMCCMEVDFGEEE